MSKKLYILHYPSLFGMGSNTDYSLISDDNIRYIIRKEVSKKNEGNSHFCERFTGIWNGEKFCDSSDIAEVEEDVIHKRLTTCSTYSEVNDLVVLPDNIPLTVRNEKLENRIFHIWNQYMTCFHDIIAGETIFTRYFLDLTDLEGFAELEGNVTHEFDSFEMNRTLENSYFMNDIETFLEMKKNRYLRFESKMNGTYKMGEGKYLDDLVDMDDEKLYVIYKKVWEEVSEKFSVPITCDDTYLEHFYTDLPNEFHESSLRGDLKFMRKFDFRNFVYRYPLYYPGIGVISSPIAEEEHYFRYDELFTNGCDFKYLLAIRTNSYDKNEKISGINAFRALRNVFGDL